MGAVIVDAKDWKAGSPIYYMLGLGNDTYTVLNAGSGYAYDTSASYALTSPDNNTLRFEVRAGDNNWYDRYSKAERSEVSSVELIKQGVPAEISYKFTLEPGAANTATGWLAFGQLIQDATDGQTGAPPGMSINMFGEKMAVMVRYRDSGGQLVEKKVFLDTQDIQRGHTYDIDIKAVFDATGNGRLVVVRDGQVIADYTGPMGYADTKGVYWKEGIYRSPAAETIAATYSDLQINIGDMVEVPKAGAAYAPAAAAPTLALATGALAKDGTVTATFKGTGPAGSGIKIYDGAHLVAQGVSGADGAYAITVTGIPAGSNVFTATATDAAGHLSKVSAEVVLEVGTSADILGRIDAIAAKVDLKGVYLTDNHVFTVASLAQMQSMNALDQDVLAKIAGGYQFQFWSGSADNRTLTRYDADGTLVSSYTAVTKDGVLVRETFVDATAAATYAREVHQYGITGKTYVETYQAYDKAGTLVLLTRTHADGTLDYWSKVDASGTLTKIYDAAGKLKSTSLAGSDGVTVLNNYNAAGDVASKITTYADKSTDTQVFTNGVLTSEFVTHAPGSAVMKEAFTYHIAGQSYVTVHQSYSASNQLLTEFKTRADGSLDTVTWLATDGSTRTRVYDSTQQLTSEKIVLVDKSTDVKTYVAGVQTREVITHADGTKEIWDFGISGKAYGSLHRWYDTSGKQTSLEYVAATWVDTKFAADTGGLVPVDHADLVPAPTVSDTKAQTVAPGFKDGIDLGALFSASFYSAANPDVTAAGVDPLAHYGNYGWHEGRDPNALFSTVGYLAANPDVAASGVNPLAHYDGHGWKEGRDPSAGFDNELYLARNPDVKAAGLDPLAHYLQYGQAEGRQAYAAVGKAADLAVHPGFDAEYYLLSNADVAKAAAAAGGDTFAFAYRHYEATGWHEGRNPNAVFDTKGYLSAYADVKAADIDPLGHYEQYGFKEGRDPSAHFDTKAYEATHADVKAAGLDPMLHYLQYGALEGRTAFDDGHFG